MGEHTPGPWRVNKYGSIGAGERGTEPVVAQVEPFYGVDQKYGSHADNARLIAAAPELLEALEELGDIVDAITAHELSVEQLDSFTTQPARAAIAKARAQS